MGYRDALIWETVRDVAEPGRRIALLTANHRDFAMGAPNPSLTRDVPADSGVTVLNKLAEVRPWLAGQGPRTATA